MKNISKVNPAVGYLKNKQILYAVVDQSQINKHHHALFTRVKDMTMNLTERLANSGLPGAVKFFDDIDAAMDSSNNFDIVIIQSVGNFIQKNIFLEHLNSYCENNPDFYLIAFTLDWDAEHDFGWLECHNQMMVVNVKTWQNVGSPKFGGWETVSESLPNYTRSEENFHDKYTPFWIKGDKGSSVKTRTKQGWSFIKAGLEKGLRIDNFNQEMRDCRLYVYPEFESENLYSALINRDEKLVKNSNQKKWIRKINYPKNVIWVYNSENYNFDNINNYNFDLYFGPAAGFKYLDVLKYNPKVDFIFYDYNKDSVEWLKELKENWDGKDYPCYLKSKPLEYQKLYKYINGDIKKNQEMLLSEFGGKDNFKKLWDIFKQSKAEFIVLDLFDTEAVTDVLKKHSHRSMFFYFSNIFSTDFTTMNFSREDLENRYRNFLNILDLHAPKSLSHGANPSGKYLDY